MNDQRSTDAVLRILAISGSLRIASSNTALLRAARSLAPEPVEISVYDGIAILPLFNPDDDGDAPHQVVLDLRTQIGRADKILMASPEYAHGVPGALKNVLGWLVSSIEFPEKPVALLNIFDDDHVIAATHP
jgi:NAD(P)H-dependent FMN reductase